MNTNLSSVFENSNKTPAFAPGFETGGLPAQARWSFITRNVLTEDVSHAELLQGRTPQTGDLVLARVHKVGHHTRIQLRGGRRALLYPGDLVILAFGNRYAPDQFEAVVPEDLNECHLVAAGGIAARAISRHRRLRQPTSLRPEGFCVDASGEVINLARYAVKPGIRSASSSKPVFAVLGTSMNSGKTTTAAALVKGYTEAGCRVAAIKATGTGAGNDLWAYADAGAHITLDFTDAGYASTYKLPQADIQECFDRLLSAAHANAEIDLIVVEIADGLLHGETSNLLGSQGFQRQVDHVLFAAGEAMGAMAGVDCLRTLGVKPTALSGLLSASRDWI